MFTRSNVPARTIGYSNKSIYQYEKFNKSREPQAPRSRQTTSWIKIHTLNVTKNEMRPQNNNSPIWKLFTLPFSIGKASNVLCMYTIYTSLIPIAIISNVLLSVEKGKSRYICMYVVHNLIRLIVVAWNSCP